MSEIDLLRAEVQELRETLTRMKNTVATWGQNGADELFTGHGFQRFANGKLRLDKLGVQIRSSGTDVPTIYWTDEFVSNSNQLSSGISYSKIQGASDGDIADLDLFTLSSDQVNSYVGVELHAETASSQLSMYSSAIGGQAELDISAASTTDRKFKFKDGRLVFAPVTSSAPAQITSDKNDYDPWTNDSNVSRSDWTLRLSSDAARTITGIDPPYDAENGTFLWLHNVGSNNITLTHEDSSSAADSRFYFDGNDVVLAPQQSILLYRVSWYDALAGTYRWIAFAHYHNATAAAGGGGMSLIVKAADETVNNSNVLQDDDHLTFAVAANEKWQFEGVLFVSSAATADIKVVFAGPTGAVGGWGVYWRVATAEDGIASALGTDKTLQTTGPTTPMPVRFWGSVTNGATAGNLKLQWAQGTTEISDTKVLAGSYIKYQQQV